MSELLVFLSLVTLAAVLVVLYLVANISETLDALARDVRKSVRQ